MAALSRQKLRLMLNDMKPLVFFGSDNFSLPILKALVESGWPIKAVVTKTDKPSGRGQRLSSPPVKALADERDIPVLQPIKLGEAVTELSNYGVQYGVVASYGRIIPDSVLELFTGGLINVHPSLSPKYRGPAPIEAAILNGDSETGISIMRLATQMDAGPIYSQEVFKLTGRETRPQLYQVLAELSAKLLLEMLPSIVSGQLQPKPQDDTKATTVKLFKKEDGKINWTLPADQIDRQIRALLGWPGSQCNLLGTDVTITAAHIPLKDEPLAKQLSHPTGSGLLIIDHLKPAGKREMTGSEFLAGHPSIDHGNV